MIYRAAKKDGFSFFKRVGITFLFLLPFTYDIVITNLLSGYYCLVAPPHPKTKIEKKVEYPISIYWEDNVYPGFSKEDRELMIINYLDGVHLKTMALNGDDGKIYVYHLDKPILKQLKQNYSTKDWYAKGLDKYTQIIMQTQKVYTKESMPKLNYTVTFNEIPLNFFERKFLYSDETKVIENNTNKVIAYNRRYMRFFYNIFPDFEVGGRYYDDAMCGDWYRYYLKVFGMLNWRLRGSGDHKIYINNYLYNKYIKGEK